MNPIRLRFLEDKIDFLEGIAIVRGLDMITFLKGIAMFRKFH